MEVIINNIWNNIPTLALLIGGLFALLQWSRSKEMERAELEKNLIEKVNDDEIISKVMNMIDWDKGLEYDGEFSINSEISEHIEFDDIELSVDKTLAHYSYICYLNERRIFKAADIVPFEYDLSRIFNNPHICNYLYTMYHFSDKNNVKCSFYYLITYGLKRGFINKSFKNRNTDNYTYFLD